MPPAQTHMSRIGGACFICRAKKRKVCFLRRTLLLFLSLLGYLFGFSLSEVYRSITQFTPATAILTLEYSVVAKSEFCLALRKSLRRAAAECLLYPSKADLSSMQTFGAPLPVA